MIINEKIAIKMLNEISRKILYKEELNEKEINLLNSLIICAIQDLGGEYNVNDSSGGEKKA